MIVLPEWKNPNNKSPKMDKFILAGVYWVMQTSPKDASKIKPLSPGVLDELSPGENLYVIGHGASAEVTQFVKDAKGQYVTDAKGAFKEETKHVGTKIEGIKPDQLAQTLSGTPPTPSGGVKPAPSPTNIVLMACSAGQDARGAKSYLARTCDELGKTTTKVPHSGLMTAWKGCVIPEFRQVKEAGPSIKEKKAYFEHVAKHGQAPMELRMRVIKDDCLDKAEKIQNNLLAEIKKEDPMAQYVFDEVEQGPGSIEMRAAHSARNLQKFYTAFVEECDKQGCLYQPNDPSVQVNVAYSTQGA